MAMLGSGKVRALVGVLAASLAGLSGFVVASATAQDASEPAGTAEPGGGGVLEVDGKGYPMCAPGDVRGFLSILYDSSPPAADAATSPEEALGSYERELAEPRFDPGFSPDLEAAIRSQLKTVDDYHHEATLSKGDDQVVFGHFDPDGTLLAAVFLVQVSGHWRVDSAARCERFLLEDPAVVVEAASRIPIAPPASEEAPSD